MLVNSLLLLPLFVPNLYFLDIHILALLKRVYDINRALLRSQPTPTAPKRGITESGGNKEEETVVEGGSFLLVLLS
ncbi:MAG: hypothetical protein F6K48_14080 [Okeania sp. SIO3H1]|nr:hypothetical protein [Okeania sp. SIO3H1]